MERHGNLKVYFDLNEVESMINSHAFSCSMEASTVIFTEFKDFITSYAPYTIVSDIAWHFEELSGKEVRDYSVNGIVDLNPVHLDGKLAKAEVLSYARAAFWVGFFTKEGNKEAEGTDAFINKMDSLYRNLKYQFHNGYNSIARYFSFLFANRDITVDQINKLATLVLKRSSDLDYTAMGLILILGTFTSSRKELERAYIRVQNFIFEIKEARTNGFQRKPVKNQVNISITNFLFLCKALELVKYAKKEEMEDCTFGQLLKEFLPKFRDFRFGEAEEWFLPLDSSASKEAVLFCHEVADLLELN